MAGAAPGRLPGHRPGRHPRPLLPRQRGRLILELDRGRAYPYEGNYTTYLETSSGLAGRRGPGCAPAASGSWPGSWVRAGTKGRHQGLGLRRYEELAAEAERDRPVDFDEIQVLPGPRLGDVVVEADGLTKGYGDRLLIDDLSFSLPWGGIVGVIPANGAGKTTLFKLVTEAEAADGASRGWARRCGWPTSTRTGPAWTPPRPCSRPSPAAWTTSGSGREMPTRAYVATFGFKGTDQQKPAGVLSGGERNRLNLALTLREGGNLLLLDEPTNDLDIDTLRSLESALLDFAGCVRS